MFYIRLRGVFGAPIGLSFVKKMRIAVPFVVLLVIGSMVVHAADIPVTQSYRHHNRDGANSALLLLRICGKNPPRLLLPLASLADIAVQIRESGMAASVYRMKTDDLSKIPAPSIVLCESGDLTKGQMVVFLGVSDSGSAIVFDGATCIVSAVSPDHFLRSFTGRGVVVTRPGESISPIAYCVRGFAVLVLILSALYYWHRVRRACPR